MKKIFLTLFVFIFFSFPFLEGKVITKKVDMASSYYHFLEYSTFISKYRETNDIKYLIKALEEISKSCKSNPNEPYLLSTKIETEIEFYNSKDVLTEVLKEIDEFGKKFPQNPDLFKLKGILYEKLSKVSSDAKKSQKYLEKSIEFKEKYLKKVKFYPQFNLDVGMYYFRRENFEKAKWALEPLAGKKTNEGIFAALFLADIYHSLGEYKKSLDLIKWYTSFFKYTKDTLRLAISDCIKLKKYREAEELFKKLLEIDPENVESNLEYARFLLSYEKKCDEALRVLNRIKGKIEENGDNFLKYKNLLFFAYDCLGERMKALSILKKLAEGGNNYLWAVKYADYNMQLGNYSEALNVYRSVYEMLTGKNRRGEIINSIRYKIIYLYFNCGMYEELYSFTKGTDFSKIDKFPFEEYFKTLLILRKFSELKDTLANLKKLKNKSNGLEDLIFLYSAILKYYGDNFFVKFGEFDDFLSKNLKTFGKKDYIFLADTYYTYTDRKDEFLKYIRSKSKSLNKKSYIMFLISTLIDLGRGKDALKFMDILKNLKPSSSMEYNNIGYLLIDGDMDVDRGIKFVKKALKNEPFNPLFLDSLSWGYYKKGMYKKAYEYFKKANLYGGKNPEILEHGGDIAYKLKLYSDALKFYKMALKKSFSKRDLDRLKGKMKKIKKPVLLRK